MKQTDVTIIGAGLTGLTLQYLLRDHTITIAIIEARNRIGGRIHTTRKPAGPSIEMGATWLGNQHTSLLALLEELGLETFYQQLGKKAIYEPISTSPWQFVTLPPNDQPSYRIKNGSSTLIEALTKDMPEHQLHLNQTVQSIHKKGDLLEITTQNNTFQSRVVISTLPPNLLKQTVSFQPELVLSTSEIMRKTHTWMGESIKFALVFPDPFWRSTNSSGTVFSNVGPIPELYDHSNVADDQFALKGFLNGSYYTLSKEQRLSMILTQLRKYYGDAIDKYSDYQETVWIKEKYTYTGYEQHVLPHQNNGHAVYQQSLMDGQLFIAGSETANAFPGYMEGAIRSAKFIYDQIVGNILQ